VAAGVGGLREEPAVRIGRRCLDRKRSLAPSSGRFEPSVDRLDEADAATDPVAGFDVAQAADRAKGGAVQMAADHAVAAAPLASANPRSET